MPTPNTPHPDKLRAWRLAKAPTPRPHRTGPRPLGWSQAEAAAHLGVPLRTYQAWEAGHRPVPHWVAPYLDGRLP
jgi:hypothetical protein